MSAIENVGMLMNGKLRLHVKNRCENCDRVLTTHRELREGLCGRISVL